MSTPVRARLYDAEGHDRDVEIEPGMVSSLEDRQLLWIDVGSRDRGDLDRVAAAAVMDARLTGRLARETGRADLTLYPDHVHLVTEAMDPDSSAAHSASPASWTWWRAETGLSRSTPARLRPSAGSTK